MIKGMIITVGIGRGVEHAIVLSIRNNNPNYVVFLVTNESKETLKRVEDMARKLGFQLPTYCHELISNEYDVEEAYNATIRAIHKLRERGVALGNITIDYTSGSKPMSAGALYAAIAAVFEVSEGCASIVYVTGRRDEDGRVISGTEKLITQPNQPNRLLADRYLTEAVRLFNSWQFAAAKQLIDNFLNLFPSSALKDFSKLDGLRKLCEAYQEWDAFNHINACKAFKAIDKTVMQQWKSAGERIAGNKGWVNMLASKLQSQDLSEKLCEELLIDLWANALRRYEENRFVDAVARLYRLCELIAQFRLWHQYKINTSSVDVEEIDEDMRKKLERYRDEKGIVKLPLQASYELLAYLGDEIGNAWNKPKLREVLNARNNSIAAHGLKPVNKEVVEKLKEEVELLLRKVIHDLDQKIDNTEFPSLQP